MKLQLYATALTLLICVMLREDLRKLPLYVLFFFGSGLCETLHVLMLFCAALRDGTDGSEATHDRGSEESEFEDFERPQMSSLQRLDDELSRPRKPSTGGTPALPTEN